MESNPSFQYLNTLLYECPAAYADVQGNNKYPDLYGMVRFYPTEGGTLVNGEIYGLPVKTDTCSVNIYAFHIHEGTSCTGNKTDPFADAKGHFNPDNCVYPAYAGIFPSLFADKCGFAWCCFFDSRFDWQEIVGRVVIIHEGTEDFHTPPAGNAGDKIACGLIVKY